MAQSRNRDEFSLEAKRKLAERVGTLCSKPSCRVATKGPHSDPDAVLSLGQACHIHAAAPKGPRHDPHQTAEQRRSLDNGIWLCVKHAREIDADEHRFPASELRRWKAETERYVREQMEFPSDTISATRDLSMIAIGPEVIAMGKVLRQRGSQWFIKIEEFIVGDLAALLRFGDCFDNLGPEDCFFVWEAGRVGRLLMAPPAVDSIEGLQVELSVAAPLQREDALRHYHVDRLGPDCALDFSDGEPDLDTTGLEIEGAELLPQILYMHLSTNKGGWEYGAESGSRVAEFYHRFDGERIESFITTELIRLATVPCMADGPEEQQVPFGFVERVREVRVLPSPDLDSGYLRASLTLDIFGMSPSQQFVISISLSIAGLGPKPCLHIPGLDASIVAV